MRRGRDIRNNRAISSTGGVGGFCSRPEEDPLTAVLGVGLAWLVTLAVVTVRDRHRPLEFQFAFAALYGMEPNTFQGLPKTIAARLTKET